ncbi:YdaS family helix-turn-helix protein [Paraburkholderia domus]|uniref:Uncharacterized protein n=1 Tax=Paraburkholderia domus TaxID=2793075 RepID=A0A9N8R7F4_9BURK|nr:YdaS family helix-turn-helix protein [Paraburkholderia domus]MBK5162785.1 helix-turn-helix domain-containing protein [Burkholderia sp. R-70211]CAE6958961.1 hypothetical protein R70211_06795 [Paraburkholderia domus]
MNNDQDGMVALSHAVRLCKTQTELARRINTDSRRLWNWMYRDHQVPLAMVPFVVDAVNNELVTPETLRPDFAEGWRLLAKQLARSVESHETLSV